MQEFFLNRRLKRIEREANDDLRLVCDLGPEDFPTHELHHLLSRLNRQQRAVGRIQTFLFLTCMSTALWVVIAFVLFSSDRTVLAYGVLALVPICGLILLLGVHHREQRFFTYRYHDEMVRRIQGELERRRKDARIY